MRYRIMTVSLIVMIIITVFQISLVLAATSTNPSSCEGGLDWNTDYNAWSGMAGEVPAILSGSHNVLNADTHGHGVGFTTSIISPTISPGGTKTYLIYLPMVTKRRARTFYIDVTGGNDSNNGRSPDQAWRTLRKVYTEFSQGTFSGGDSILFKRGGTWTATAQGRLRVWNVAETSSTNPLYIGAYGTGSKPKIDGRGAVWTWLLGSHRNDGAIDHVVVEDLAITGSNAQSVYLYGVQDWTLRHLNIGEMSNSKGNALQIRHSSYVYVDDCDITTDGVEGRSSVYIGTADDPADRPSYIYITNSYIHDCSTVECIDLKPGCRHVTIEGNILTNAQNEVISLRGDHHVVRGNVISKGSMGICGWDSQGEGWLIENNLIKDIHGQSEGGNGEGIKIYGAGHTVRNNTVADCADAALKIRAFGVTVRNNIFYRSKVGIDLVSGYGLPDSDYNSFHSLPMGGLYLASYGGYQTISTACSRRGIECHSITSDPDFLDEIDYEIDSSSPCYHADDNGSSIGYYEPDAPPSTPTPTPTKTPLPTYTPTPTSTSIPSLTNTPTSLPTNTPAPTNTSLPTNTPTPTSTSTPTPTPTNTPLPTYTPTPTSTSMPSPTNTPTFAPTNTPAPTNTLLPTDTPTLIPTGTPTPTPTQTLLPTYTPTATNTPLPTYTPTPT